MVNMYKQELTNLQQDILALLCLKAGTSLNQNRISKILEVSPPAVAKSLPFLEKKNYIKINKDKLSGRQEILLNREDKKNIQLKRILNVGIIYKSGLAEFLEENFPGCTIILFGSYSRGEDTEKSDIDIAIIGSKKKEINLTKFDKILERKVFLHFYNSLKELDNELKENICNGIVLVGGIGL